LPEKDTIQEQSISNRNGFPIKELQGDKLRYNRERNDNRSDGDGKENLSAKTTVNMVRTN
jgi:hypothetical protein